jgi:2-oxoglutarate ferredoxin oxidoreductase subunit alpha
MKPEKMEEINKGLQKKYRDIEEKEIRFESIQTKDADIIIVAFGLVSRIAHKTIELAREEGIKVGLFRPITLFPFPCHQLQALSKKTDLILTVEMNSGQMLEDVKLAVNGQTPVAFYGRMGGVIPQPEEILKVLKEKQNQLSLRKKV